MGGIQKLCKIYGKMKLGDVMWVWDYVNDKAVPEKEMTKEQWAANEKAKWTAMKIIIDQEKK